MTTAPLKNRPGPGPASAAQKLAPLKSILRSSQSPPTTKRRSVDGSVDDAIMADDNKQGSLSPTSKRRKTVAFDMSQNTVFNIGNRSLQDTKREVRLALEGHARGEDEGYDHLKDIFSGDNQLYHPPTRGEDGEDDSVKPAELTVYVVAMISCAPMLGKQCSGLVKTVLRCSWLGRDDDFVRAYLQFLAALCSAQGSCLEPVLSMLVDNFKEFRPSAWAVPGFPPVDAKTMKDRLHAGLRYLLGLFPAARNLLFKLITNKFPYTEESTKIHMAYVHNMPRLREYAPDLGPDLMELLTNRLVQLDMHMQVDLDDVNDDTSSAVAFQLRSSQLKNGAKQAGGDDEDVDDDDEDDSDLESLASDDSDYDEQAQKILSAKHTVQKLDGILDALFSLHARTFADPESVVAQEAFIDMLSEFINLILPTHSRHAQFLVFHFAQQSPMLSDMYIGTLLNLAFESNKTLLVKQAAAAYLASFVARGAHVSGDNVIQVVNVLCGRIEAYRQNQGPACRGPDLRRFTSIYTWTQALLYIFCFRWKDLIVSAPDIVDPDDSASYLGHEFEWIPGFRERLREAIYSRFNPLKVCSPAIVHEFAKLARALNFIYCYPKLETNRRVVLSQFASGAYANGGALRESGFDLTEEALQLEAHFPFDPYQLPASKRWLEGDYAPWRTIPGLDRDEDEDEDEDSEEDEGVLDEHEEGGVNAGNATATDDELSDD